MRKKSNNWRRVFQIALQGREGLGILLGDILTIQCLRHAADNPQINKISMIYRYRKPEVKKKYDATAMTTAIIEACIVW